MDHQVANGIHAFRDSFPILKIHLLRYAKICATSHSYPSDTRRLQCADVNNQPQTVSKNVYTVYNYSRCIINKLLSWWQMN